MNGLNLYSKLCLDLNLHEAKRTLTWARNSSGWTRLFRDLHKLRRRQDLCAAVSAIPEIARNPFSERIHIHVSICRFAWRGRVIVTDSDLVSSPEYQQHIPVASYVTKVSFIAPISELIM
jgi:hypothetical protein